MWFFRGVKIGSFEILTQLSSSSNNLHLIIGFSDFTCTCVYISSMIFIIGVISLRQVDSATCSAYVDNRAIFDCNLLHRRIGIPMKYVICPALDNRELASSGLSLFHPLTKSGYACDIIHISAFILACVSTHLVPNRHSTMYFTSFSWLSLGVSHDFAHWCSTIIASGLVVFAK